MGLRLVIAMQVVVTIDYRYPVGNTIFATQNPLKGLLPLHLLARVL